LGGGEEPPGETPCQPPPPAALLGAEVLWAAMRILRGVAVADVPAVGGALDALLAALTRLSATHTARDSPGAPPGPRPLPVPGRRGGSRPVGGVGVHCL